MASRTWAWALAVISVTGSRTVGSHLRFGQNLITTLGYSFPFTSSDRVFDGEFRVFLNRYF